MGLPKVQMGQERYLLVSSRSLLRAMSASKVPEAEPRPFLKVQLSHNDDGCP
jgi:hypothetical protein